MWNLLLPSLITLAGVGITTAANKQAGQLASNATIEGARINAAAIRDGNEKAQQTLQEMRAEAAPAQRYLRTVIAEPGTLTPAQQQQLEELRRNVTNTIHGSSFAGSGRATVGLFRRAETDFTNNALETNRSRAFDAARTMQGGANTAMAGIANSQAQSGTAIGKVTGDATAKAGELQAGSDLASGRVMGQALGDIGSLIAAQGRESRYADRLSKIEKSLGIGA